MPNDVAPPAGAGQAPLDQRTAAQQQLDAALSANAAASVALQGRIDTGGLDARAMITTRAQLATLADQAAQMHRAYLNSLLDDPSDDLVAHLTAAANGMTTAAQTIKIATDWANRVTTIIGYGTTLLTVLSL